MDPLRRGWMLGMAAAVVLGTMAPAVRAQEQESPQAVQKLYQQIVARGIQYLEQHQEPDGSFSKQVGPAVTALVCTALLRHGRSVNDPVVRKALKFLEGYIQPSGGIHHPRSRYRNYETSVAVMCFKQANRDGRYDQVLKNAERFLKQLQWDETEGKDRSDPSYGGAGYGRHKRPDLSNTSFLIEALKELGAGPDDPAMKKALVFVSRCQNLETEHNTTPFAAKNPDGGFYYTPAAGGTSQAGKTPEGGLRSYASMTYAGLKSMIYAGVDKNDPRVKAAVQWCRRHYDLKSNPGLGLAGLYYYYHTFAKALDALGEDVFEDAQGRKHHWRHELIRELASRQQRDGSWVNENSRWLEGDPNLVTAYALLALAHARPK